jgi:hypothetical protein
VPVPLSASILLGRELVTDPKWSLVFLDALRIQSDYAPAIANLAEVDRQIAMEKRHILFKYPWAPVEIPGKK